MKMRTALVKMSPLGSEVDFGTAAKYLADEGAGGILVLVVPWA